MKPLPFNSEIEAEVLGAIIVDNNKILDALEILKSNDFYKEKHRYIFNAIENLYKHNKTVDIITLMTELKPVLEAIGGITYLSALTSSTMGRKIKDHCEILKELSNKRQVIKECTNAIEKAHNGTVSKEIITEFENNILCIQNEKSQIMKIDEVMSKTLTFVEDNYRRGGGIIGMECGIKTIDEATDGFIKKNFSVIAARPSIGKTLLAMQIGDGLSKNNKVAIFELEMGEEDLGVRQLASKSMINGVKLRRGDLNDKEWANISKASANIATRQLWLDTSSSQTIFDIKAKCKRLKMQNGLDAIIIDHIGLLKTTSIKTNRNDHIGEITRQCKEMAKDLDIHVCILSQLNREVESRADKRPIMSDLRESGNIEQDADLIMFLYRDQYYNPETEDRNILEVNISKQRNGKTGNLKLFCDLGIQVIADLDVIRR